MRRVLSALALIASTAWVPALPGVALLLRGPSLLVVSCVQLAATTAALLLLSRRPAGVAA